MAEIILNEQNFESEVLNSDIPVLVDFWADWCGPCKMLGPVIEEIAREYEGKVKVGKVNVEENRALAQKYRVMGIPYVALFKDGKVVDSSVGYKPKAQLEALLK